MSWIRELFGCEPERLPLAGLDWAQWQDREIEASGVTRHNVEIGETVVVSGGMLRELSTRSDEFGRPVRAEVVIADLHHEFGNNVLGRVTPLDGGLRYDVVLGGGSASPVPVTVDQLDVAGLAPQPGRMSRPIASFRGSRFIWSVGHWYDLLVVNLLAVQSRTGALARSSVHPSAEIHPTAVIENTTIGEGVTIGPYAVVRRSEIGAGSSVQEHASISGSVLGNETVVQTQAVVHGSAVGSETVVSFQTAVRGSLLFGRSTISAPVVARSVIGPDSFLGRGVSISATTLADTAVKVRVGNRSISSGARLLGCAVGRGARIGNGITIPAGYAVPAGVHLAERPMPRVRDAHPTPAALLLDNGKFRSLPNLEGPPS